MATFKFVARPRVKNSNEPLTYDITNTDSPAGTLVKQKKRWRLSWIGTTAEFDTKHHLQRHLGLLGHRTEGLI